MKIINKLVPPTITFEEWCDSEELHIELTNSIWNKGEVAATLVPNNPDLMAINPWTEFPTERCGCAATPEKAIEILKLSLRNDNLRRRKRGWFMFGWVGPYFKVPEFKD